MFLDLDDTLVLTSAIKPLRDSRKWPAVYKSLAKTSLPTGTAEFIDEWREAVQLGAITSSPRKYAELLVAHHELSIPVLVAYHDTSRHKPHPEPILAALKKVNGERTRCIYIGDLLDDAQAAKAAKVQFVFLCWDGKTRGLSDSKACGTWADVSREIKKIISEA